MTTARYATSLTGGGAGALDAKAVATLSDGDFCFTMTGSTLYVHKFVATATDAESSPSRIRPDDYSTSGVWYEQSVGDQTPIGSVITVPYSTPPSGFLECDGSAISRTTYAALYAVLGTLYGVGDGSTTFNLPDYRGQFLRGWAHGQSTDPDKATRTDRGDGTTGDNVGTKQADAFEAHTHDVGVSNSGTYPPADYDGVSMSAAVNVYSVANAAASRGGNETRPTNINVMYCIKY